MAIQSQPSRISEPFAGSGTKNAIPATNATPSASQAASWASGFPPECSQPISAGGCPVPRNDFNGVLNQLSQDYAFRQDGGIWEWSALADYDIQRMVRGSDGLLYFSKAQSGPSVAAGAQNPVLDTAHAYWDQIPSNDANVVHRTGAETITGAKTFTANPTLAHSGSGGAFRIARGTVTRGGTWTAGTDSFSVLDSAGNALGTFAVETATSPSTVSAETRIYSPFTTSAADMKVVQLLGYSSWAEWAFAPISADTGLINLGAPGALWKEVFAASGAINTSDARLKTEPQPVPDDVLDAWGDVGFCQFQMLDSVEKKGADKARLHSGLIAQRIDEAFKARGLDASRYGLFCWDSWDAVPERRNEEGEVVVPAVPAGEQYSLRYEEALCMEAAYQRRRADRAEDRLAALEERLAAIEAKFNA